MTKSEIKKLDKIWSLAIRSKGKCEICNKKGDECQLHPHHYVGRKNRATRWYLPNGICLCATHHTMGTKSAHQDPEWFREKIIEKRGEAWLKDIIKKSNEISKETYQSVLNYLCKSTNIS